MQPTRDSRREQRDNTPVELKPIVAPVPPEPGSRDTKPGSPAALVPKAGTDLAAPDAVLPKLPLPVEIAVGRLSTDEIIRKLEEQGVDFKRYTDFDHFAAAIEAETDIAAAVEEEQPQRKAFQQLKYWFQNTLAVFDEFLNRGMDGSRSKALLEILPTDSTYLNRLAKGLSNNLSGLRCVVSVDNKPTADAYDPDPSYTTYHHVVELPHSFVVNADKKPQLVSQKVALRHEIGHVRADLDTFLGVAHPYQGEVSGKLEDFQNRRPVSVGNPLFDFLVQHTDTLSRYSGMLSFDESQQWKNDIEWSVRHKRPESAEQHFTDALSSLRISALVKQYADFALELLEKDAGNYSLAFSTEELYYNSDDEVVVAELTSQGISFAIPLVESAGADEEQDIDNMELLKNQLHSSSQTAQKDVERVLELMKDFSWLNALGSNGATEEEPTVKPTIPGEPH